MRRVIFMVGLAILSQPAFADVQDYCTAVARDFADLRPRDRDIWQLRFDDANTDCIEQFSSAPAVAAAPPKQKSKAVAVKPSKPVVVEQVIVEDVPVDPKPAKKVKKPAAKVATVEEATAEPTAKIASAKPKLTPGSAAWLDYCTRKYSSFNRAKGTYLSKTGVERKCLITADFR
jgi:hypothetical protein